ncbi:hypothetical protein, partial [Streptomyces hainanensis]
MRRETDWGESAGLALARELVARLAPDELPLFDETVTAAPRGARSRRQRDDPLGFGAVEAAAVLFTTIACGVASEVVKALAEDAGQRAAGRTRRLLRRLRRERRPAPPPDDP